MNWNSVKNSVLEHSEFILRTYYLEVRTYLELLNWLASKLITFLNRMKLKQNKKNNLVYKD